MMHTIEKMLTLENGALEWVTYAQCSRSTHARIVFQMACEYEPGRFRMNLLGQGQEVGGHDPRWDEPGAPGVDAGTVTP